MRKRARESQEGKQRCLVREIERGQGARGESVKLREEEEKGRRTWWWWWWWKGMKGRKEKTQVMAKRVWMQAGDIKINDRLH